MLPCTCTCAHTCCRDSGPPTCIWLQGVLSWVGQPQPGQDPPSFEARLYDVLFKSPEPAGLGDAWLQDLNPQSEVVLTGALASPPLAAAQPGDR